MWEMETPKTGFFTPDEKAQVTALFRQLVPSDPVRGIPGAHEAGAVDFLDRLLAMSQKTYVEIPDWQTMYRTLLPLAEAACRDRYGKGITELGDRETLEFLQHLQAGLLSSPTPADQKKLFNALHRHCIQGCFADPRWGGNKDRVAWRWFGYLQPAEEV